MNMVVLPLIDLRTLVVKLPQLKIEPKFEDYRDDDPVGFVISLNMKRRHMTKSQLAMVSVDAVPMFEKEAKKRQGSRTDINPTLVQDYTKVNDNKATHKAGNKRKRIFP